MKYVVFPDQESGAISFPLASCGDIDPHLVSVLRGSDLACFLAYEVKNDGEQPTDIEVKVQGFTSLSRLLEEPLDARNLTALFRHLHNLIEACAYHGLPFMNVVMDPHYIYSNNLLDELSFIYLPVSGKVRGIAFIKEFFLDLHGSIIPQGQQAVELTDRFSEIINADESLNLMMLSASLGGLAKTELIEEEALEQESPAIVGTGTCSCPPCSNSNQESESEPKQEVKPEVPVEPAPNPEPAEEAWTSGRHVREDPGTSVLNAVNIEELMSVVADAPATVGTRTCSCPPSPDPEAESEPVKIRDRYRLVHKRSGNATDISGAGFSVGKSKRADFQVLNTTTVSRIHALFNCTDGACYLKDNRSLNGTFVNERRLVPGEEVHLHSGDVIRMSDEEFSFEVIAQGEREVVS